MAGPPVTRIVDHDSGGTAQDMFLTTDRTATRSWRTFPIEQDPGWLDSAAVEAVVADLEARAPLVSARRCDALRHRLGEVARGRMLMVQGGDCAEVFAEGADSSVPGTVETLLQMAAVLSYADALPVVVVGRMAGQYAKPRSRPVEVRDGTALPAYRGDAVNGRKFTEAARTPDPNRLREVYQRSADTLDQIQTLFDGGGLGPQDVLARNEDFIRSTQMGWRYRPITDGIGRALAFLSAHGVGVETLGHGQFYVSHEALLLDYESALTRYDPSTRGYYDLSADMVWIGDRTRQLDGAHVEFVSRVRNPIGVKLGPTATGDTALALVDRLDPDREPGRLTFVVRMGAGAVRDRLPELVERVTTAGAQVGWVCDPMHGNTVTTPSGRKTRRFDDVLDEVVGFLEVHRGLGTHAGGLHIELTGDDVTECLGGGNVVSEDDLHRRYETACDPRLNRSQSLELAFLLAESGLNHQPGASRTEVQTA